MRQILHGSIHEIYKTLIHTFPEELRSRIPEAAEILYAYNLDGDPQHISMVPLQASGATIELLFSVCARRRNARSRSYYVHQQLISCTPSQLITDFDGLLATPFYSEEEFEAIAAGENQEAPATRVQGMPVHIHQEVLRAVLYGIVGRWRAGGDPVVIAVPESVPYSSYCLGAVSQIYSYLPAAIRGLAGFMTYTTPVRTLIDVALYFLPARAGLNTVCLSAENEKSKKLLETYLPDSLKKMIDKLVDTEDTAERQQYFAQLQKYVESYELEELKASRYTAYLDYSDILEFQPDSEEALRRLVDIFANPEKVPKQVYLGLCGNVDNQVSTAVLDAFVLPRRDEDKSFEDYMRRISFVECLCCKSEKLQAYMTERIADIFTEEFLKRAKNIEALKPVADSLENLDQSPSGFWGKKDSDYLHKLLEGRYRLLGKLMADKYVNESRIQLEAVSADNSINLENQIVAIWNDMKSSILKLKGVKFDEHLGVSKLKLDTEEIWTKKAEELLALRIPRVLTEDAYNAEKNRLESCRDHLRKKEGKLVEKATEALEALENAYKDSEVPASKALAEATSLQKTYFESLHELALVREKYPHYVNEQRSQTALEKVRQKRTMSNEVQYKKAYKKYAKVELCEEDLFSKNVWFGSRIKEDLCQFTKDAMHIDVRQKTLVNLLMEICQACGNYKARISEPTELTLRVEKESREYPAQQLCNTLALFLDQKSSKANLLPNDEMVSLLKQMVNMNISKENVLRIVRVLLDLNTDSKVMDAVSNLVKTIPSAVGEVIELTQNSPHAFRFTLLSAAQTKEKTEKRPYKISWQSNSTQNPNVSLDKTEALAGETVTVRVKPDRKCTNYEIVCDSGAKITRSKTDVDVFTFVMPEQNETLRVRVTDTKAASNKFLLWTIAVVVVLLIMFAVSFLGRGKDDSGVTTPTETTGVTESVDTTDDGENAINGEDTNNGEDANNGEDTNNGEDANNGEDTGHDKITQPVDYFD